MKKSTKKELQEFLKQNNALEAYERNIHRKKCGGIGEYWLLSGAFIWSETPEGHKYWSNLNEKFWRKSKNK